MKDVVERLRPYVLGWRRTSGWRRRHESGWIWTSGMRHRLRVIQLKHWRRGPTIYRELRALGAPVRCGATGWRRTAVTGGVTAASS
ncbi:maturase [Burkholderia cenocepacia]|uniref:maturase n=1 Tax=Burkholderia cenocepacia TaxID=95486 RepID=UPI003391C9AF